ncbi:hypothetical protein AB0J21_10190 [Streptomyces sp. NPDC049954]|uniref:hypothetical protein n=1 Tax=Streptomyces sp. NPDC049954 TaxID=3155779 RepID=UPI0034214808
MTPRDPDRAGWYERGAAPEARGPAVIALITCGGEYSQEGHHYSDNVVVYASLDA